MTMPLLTASIQQTRNSTESSNMLYAESIQTSPVISQKKHRTDNFGKAKTPNFYEVF